MNQYGFFVDLSRCIGCNACTIACKQWHDIAVGPAKPMRVYQWETGAFPNVALHMLPIMCYHCETPACLESCENNAIYKEEKYGAVLVDPEKCQGSRKCFEACPYGSPQFEGDEPGRRMVKCTMCVDRLDEGLKPICVLSCGMRALEFGPLDDIVRKYGHPNRVGPKPGHAPCRMACPAGVDAEAYIALISEGKFREAIQVFRETSPFAGVLGRVCTHPCEADCQRGKFDDPVPIRLLKRAMADYELKEGREKATPVAKTKTQSVAVVGAGPAGLSCAYDLVRKGYPVTVFEAAPQSGGMMRYVIPEYRLPNRIVDNEVRYIEEMGVEIKTNSPVKKLEDIFSKGYHAIFLATGTWVSQSLGAPNEETGGVMYALDFLKRANSGEKIEAGRNVAVIGGGSVAVDAARVALRLGVQEVHLVCLESRDLTCKDRMFAQDLEIEDAEREGVVIHANLGVSKILSEKGSVVGLETVSCTSVMDEEGRFAPKFAGGPASTIETDMVIVAIGQKTAPEDFSDVVKTPSGNIRADKLTLETNIEGVFAGADVVTGPSNIISVIADGKRAALSIDRFLSGEDLRVGRDLLVSNTHERTGGQSPRSQVLAIGDRKGFSEVEHGLDEETARDHAKDCLRCGTIMPCVVFKPADPRGIVVPWDATRALELWQKRQPYDGESLPEVFADLSAVTEAPPDIVGRNRLVLKAKSSEELMYHTMDDE